MDTLKKFAKYVLLVVVVYLFSNFLIFFGLNVNYKNIELTGELPSQIKIDKAEATKEEGRVYGKVKNSTENNLNGKYIKVSIFNASGDNIATELLKIENLEPEEEKAFKSRFSAENATNYEINIIENK